MVRYYRIILILHDSITKWPTLDPMHYGLAIVLHFGSEPRTEVNVVAVRSLSHVGAQAGSSLETLLVSSNLNQQ